MSAEDRAAYVRSLLDDMRDSIMDLRDTEFTHRIVHEEYAWDAATDHASQLLARQKADGDARITRASALGAYYRDRIQTLALAYLAEATADARAARRSDDRKARR